MAARRVPPKKKVLKRKPRVNGAENRPKPPKPPPLPPDPSMQQMQAEVARAEAQKRVAAFLERTMNQTWLRQRLGSFEIALLGGVRNLLNEASSDEETGRLKESRAAHFSFLYGLFTSLRYLFFWYALQARVADVSESQKRPPEMEDAEHIMRELDIFNSAASRDDVQARFRKLLAEGGEVAEARRRVLEQAKIFDALNSLREVPKA